MRLIDADVLTDSLDSLCDMVCQYSKIQRSVMCGACPLGGAFDVIDSAPTVDPIKHGHWIEVDTQYIDETKCSNCGVIECFNKGWKRFNYCPNCGAKMDEVEEDEQPEQG